MKILVIDNNTKHLDYLKNSLAGQQLEIQKYHPGMIFNDSDKDLVILSGGGGQGKEANDVVCQRVLWYQTEMDYVKKSQKPILGICMGFELIAQAYGSKVDKLPALVKGWHRINLFSRLTPVRQFENHRWSVKKIDRKKFDVLADSPFGIEMIKHRSRPIVATQFHPEIPGSHIYLPSLLGV